MKKLISMTDFVLEQNKTFRGYDEYIRRTTLSYANFLKQPLELWMFDENDERCLFEGIRGYKICNNGGFYIYYNKNSMIFINKKDTIETITNCNLKLKNEIQNRNLALNNGI